MKNFNIQTVKTNTVYEQPLILTNDILTNPDGVSFKAGSTAYNTNWTLITSTEFNAPSSFTSVAIDGTGQYRIAAADQVYTSNDFGKTWNAKGLDTSITDVAISKTAEYQIVFSSTSGVYMSDDFGENWEISLGTSALGLNPNKQLAISNTGQYIVVSIRTTELNGAQPVGGVLFTSNDYGATWALVPAFNDARPNAATMSGDGKYTIINTYSTSTNNYQFYKNYDFLNPNSWQVLNGISTDFYGYAFISNTGKYQIIPRSGLYSDDYGATWISKTFLNDILDFPEHIIQGAISNSGQIIKLAIGAPGGRPGNIYTSYDYGDTWEPDNLDDTSPWKDIDISFDAKYQIACRGTDGAGGIIRQSEGKKFITELSAVDANIFVNGSPLINALQAETLVNSASSTLKTDYTTLVNSTSSALKTDYTSLVNSASSALKTDYTTLVNSTSTTLESDYTSLIDSASSTLKTDYTSLVDSTSSTLKSDYTTLVNSTRTTLKTDYTSLVNNTSSTLKNDYTTLVNSTSNVLVKKEGDVISGNLLVNGILQTNNNLVLNNSLTLQQSAVSATDTFGTLTINGSGFAFPLYTYNQIGNMSIDGTYEVF